MCSYEFNNSFSRGDMIIRGVIEKFVDCLYKIKTPYDTSVKFQTFLKHHIFKLHKK